MCTVICIIGVPEEEEREKGIENVFEEIVAETFPNLKKKTDIQVQEAHRVPHKKNPIRVTPRRSIIKMAKVKDIENYKVNWKTRFKMAVSTYLSIITLNISGLNAPIKRQSG